MQQGRLNPEAIEVRQPHQRRPEMRSIRRIAEHELDVGNGKFRARLDERVQPTWNHRCWTCAEDIGLNETEDHPVDAHHATERSGVRTCPRQRDGRMILQVLSDRKVDDRLDAHLIEVLRWPYA